MPWTEMGSCVGGSDATFGRLGLHILMVVWVLLVSPCLASLQELGFTGVL